VVRHHKQHMGCITGAMNITKNCDSLGVHEKPLIEDIGLLASQDPVAIDQAVLDLFRERSGKTLEQMSYPEHDASVQLRYAKRSGSVSARWISSPSLRRAGLAPAASVAAREPEPSRP